MGACKFSGLPATKNIVMQHLSQGVLSLSSACALPNDPKEKQQLIDKTHTIQRRFTHLSNNMGGTTSGIRYFTRLDPEGAE